MDIETTPKSFVDNENSVSSLGRRHTPTARMSERKRNLFDKKLTSIMDDDVDLGPMSPLQYSSSPTSCEEDNRAHAVPFDRNAKQTNFSNIFPGTLKPTGSPIQPVRTSFSSTDKNILVVEESASSTMISIQSAGTPQPKASELTTIPEEDKSVPMQEKTPRTRMINCQDLRVSFKKSLILGDDVATPTIDDSRAVKGHQKRSYSMSVLTENGTANSLSKTPKEKIQKLDSADNSRARTSLTFDSLSIPTNKFYSANSRNDENRDSRQKRYSMNVLLPRDHRSHSTGKNKSRRSREFERGVTRNNCSHKIKKPTRAAPKEATKKKLQLAVQESKENLSIDEAQTTRINEILKNIKNPLEMSRPLFFTAEKTDEDRFRVSDEEDEQEEMEKSKRKFFKSGTTGAKSYKLSNNVVATVEGGKIMLPKFPSASSGPLNKSATDPSEFSMVEEEFGSEFEEVTDIISKLTNDDEMDAFRSRIPYQTTDPQKIEKQAEMLEMLIANKLCTEENFKIFIAEPEKHPEEMNRIMDELVGVRKEQSQNFFPIFYQRQTKRKLVSLGLTEEKQKDVTVGLSRKVWKRIGDSQLQIDAGQKRFGATYCAQCDLLYSVHEPEDEIMHERFHSALSVLAFNGWKSEEVIREMPHWGVNGRIIAVPWNEGKVKLHRVKVVLDVINREMGCPSVDLKSKTIVYLAVAQNIILGVCVAEAKYEANRLVTENGIDFFSEEIYPIWCGISRIWVAAPYRNQGLATDLVGAVRSHFTVGRTLAVEEIAFQSPTEAGKLLGTKLSNRKDFLVYP